MLINSKRWVGAWGIVFGDPVVATEILDRLPRQPGRARDLYYYHSVAAVGAVHYARLNSTIALDQAGPRTIDARLDETPFCDSHDGVATGAVGTL